MDLQLLSANLLNPPVLFFGLGLLAVLLRSDLKFPESLPKALSLYLLLAIGFRGGVELHKSGMTQTVATLLAAAIAMAVVVPVCACFGTGRRCQEGFLDPASPVLLRSCPMARPRRMTVVGLACHVLNRRALGLPPGRRTTGSPRHRPAGPGRHPPPAWPPAEAENRTGGVKQCFLTPYRTGLFLTPYRSDTVPGSASSPPPARPPTE